MIELGESIRLSGFKEQDSGTMVILKKMIGNHVRKISEVCTTFDNLSLTLKEIHKTNPKTGKYEIHGKCICSDGEVNSEVTGLNIFVTVDEVLKKLEHQMNNKK